MKALTRGLVGVALLAFTGDALAYTKADQCNAYARDAASATPTTTGAGRGAARGAVVGSISGNAGRGAATGAVVGGVRKGAQKNRSYQYYFDQCMRG